MTTPTQLPIAPFPVRFVCDVSTSSPTVTGLATRLATDLLWALTGRQFGIISVKSRPYRWVSRDTPYPDGWQPWPGSIGWAASGYYGVFYGEFDYCGHNTAVEMPNVIKQVTEVKVDGQVLDPSAYSVVDQRYVYRIDGGTWPMNNAVEKDDTVAGTWSITADFGLDPPAGIELAMGELACEFLRALNGEDCRLPRNITSIARQGVTITLPDVSTAFKAGLTGLRTVDMFIKTWNPNALKRRAQAYSVDRVTAIRRRG